ncbi:sensor histidine kinase [Diaminobutyricibacter sp. McL0618]|uniref:sensor histidine kinase n=1 Tax=Leifsonia sp. McL0618 TaxID=3415677 RepID=UPI003CF81ACC
MTHTALTPVFVGLRTGLHVVFVALTVLVIVRAIVAPTPSSLAVIVLCLILLATYALGGLVAHSAFRGAGYLWLLALSLEWIVLVWLIPEAAYLVFPLFFLYLHLLPGWWGPLAVLAATALAIVALGLHGGWTVGGIVGPLVGAGVAILIGLGYRSLARESQEREQLMDELIATRDQLAETEHESGVLAERARLAREIHDTVAQGLSSIQMLLHAAEREAPDGAGTEYIRLARETAASNLADTRRFIRELTPSALVDQGIGAALRRLAETQWSSDSLQVHVRVSDAIDLPIDVQTALLRIAQGAMANVVQHADARSATITIDRDADTVRLTISDDGRGFDPAAVAIARASGASDSFGLTAARERVDQLGGTLTIDAEPGRGAIVTVELKLEADG